MRYEPKKYRNRKNKKDSRLVEEKAYRYKKMEKIYEQMLGE